MMQNTVWWLAYVLAANALVLVKFMRYILVFDGVSQLLEQSISDHFCSSPLLFLVYYLVMMDEGYS